jgi:hypothetical protein
MEGKIRNRARYRQIYDLSGYPFPRNITPSDIDFIVEMGRENIMILGEFKHDTKFVKRGQKRFLEAFLTALSHSKRVLGFIAYHQVSDPNEDVNGYDCIVSQYWTPHKWRTPKKEITVRQLLNAYLNKFTS